MNLAFAGSLRIGELLGLTWDCVDISEEAIKENRAYLYVNKEVQRVSKKALEELDQKDVIVIFPEEQKTNKTVRIMKTPKTESSVRKVFLPRSVAEELIAWKAQQIHDTEKRTMMEVPEGVDAELLAKVLSNPEMAVLLTSLAKSMQGEHN